MAILRCNKCGLLHEPDESAIGQEIPCPKCASPVRVYRTLFFVDALLKKHREALREIKRLQSAATTPIPVENAVRMLDDVDLFNTDYFASDVQHEKIRAWFLERGIKTQINPESVDTTGFYDEIGTEVGSNFLLYKDILDAIRWAQREQRPSCQVRLEKKSDADGQAIVDFCRKLYDVTLVSKIFHDRKEKTLKIWIQSAKNVQQFFDGVWLEWHALMSILTYSQQQKKSFSCARNIVITLGNGDKYELDVFALIGVTPVCIECKSGEFRQYIEKAQLLRKKLGIDSAQFIMCISGLDVESLPGFSAMHKLTFANESTLSQHLKSIVGAAS
ncbi:hypothetical protein AGMMS50256_02540 [Betaproteobacteria bacterium]|nr:hypothetical protein AGMMS50256_02540 [Betaproteobacteria bacterium]